MIEGLDIVYYGPEPWAGMWRSRHQLLSRLARANRVLYVEPRPYLRTVVDEWRSGVRQLRNLTQGGATHLLDGLWLYRTPAYGAIGGGPVWRPVARWWRVRHLRSTLTRLKMGRPLVWLSHPSQADACDDLPARLRVYHLVDDYLAYGVPGDATLSWLGAWEQRIVDWSDLILAVTPELIRDKDPGGRKAQLLPNAADVDAYQAALSHPAGLPAGASHPAIGYSGLVSARLDLDSLAECARRRPDWSWIFVGEVIPRGCEDALERLKSLANVHFLGVRPASEIPAIITGWDVGLIPYRVNAETRSASPLKLYEYLAAGLPVVSSDVPAVRPFSGLVAIVSGPDELEHAIIDYLANDTLSERLARWGVVRAHSWDERVLTLSEMLSAALESLEKHTSGQVRLR